MRVSIDRQECIACGACYQECPSVFEENPDDTWSQITEPYRVKGDIALGDVPSYPDGGARAGAEVCPVSIIHTG